MRQHITKIVLGLLLLPALSAPVPAEEVDPAARDAVGFMRSVMDQVNPALAIEDSHCVKTLPRAIYKHSEAMGVDWREVFTLAWQESAFDCHAKNRRDRGGAYGPFQIRRLWEAQIGDPRIRYYDPELAVKRVLRVLRYYRESDRYKELKRQGFRFPLLCLYNAGESQQVGRGYCLKVGRKMDAVRKGWKDYQAGRLVAISG
jgi:hypothetical protein